MFGVVTDVGTLLSKGDAMWCLLLCGMNETLARAMEDSVIPLFTKEPRSHRRQKGAPSSSPLLPVETSVTDLSNVHPMQPSAAATGAFLTAPIATHLQSVSLTPTPLLPHSVPNPDNSCMSGSIANSISRTPQAEIATDFVELTSHEGLSRVLPSIAVDNCAFTAQDEAVEGEENSVVISSAVCMKCDERFYKDKLSNLEPDTNVGSGESRVSVICKAASEIALASGELCSCLYDHCPAEGLEKACMKQVFSRLGCPESSAANFHAGSCDGQSLMDFRSADLPLGAQKPSLDMSAKLLNKFEISGLGVEPQETASCPLELGSVDEEGSTLTHDRISLTTPFSEDEMASFVDAAAGIGGSLQAANVVKEVPDCICKQAFLGGNGDMEDQNDERIVKLNQRLKDLETQLQERTEWAKQKVMQAAWRLSKDLQELKALRLEREEAQRLRKEKQALEESTKKKINDLENALRKASGQVDRANASVRKLEGERAEVRADIEATRLSAAETLSSFLEMAKRERNHIKRAQAWEKEKAKLQEDLSEEKRKVNALQQQLTVAKERQQQAEVRWRQEQKAKEDAVYWADHERRTRELSETAAKKREEALRRKSEANEQRHREEIQRLGSEIAQYRTSAESAQLATSRWGVGVAFTPSLDTASLQGLKELNMRLSREVAELQDMSRRDVHRERECVMCMCEEMSVVFLPCAHQVVCVKCNELHEKQGMRDCPSCRTPIKQRVQVFGAGT